MRLIANAIALCRSVLTLTADAINRHKQTTLTPGLHMEQYSPDDHRYDMRPFLYPSFTAQYRKMERTVEALEEGDGDDQQINGA